MRLKQPLFDDDRRPAGSRLAARLAVTLGLLFLALPVSDLAHADIGSVRRAALALGLAAFIAIYWSLMPPAAWVAASLRRVVAALTALTAIAAGLLLAGAPASFTALFVYVVTAASMLLPLAAGLGVIAATALGVGIGAAVAQQGVSAITSWVLTILSIGAIMASFGRMIRSNRELREAREDLAILAVAEERLRIARDLHDLLGHSLSVIALKTEVARRVVHDDAHRAASELVDIEQVTRQALAEVRGAVVGYRRFALEDALDGARVALSAAGIDYRLDDRRSPVPSQVEAVLAWAVREGTTNVVRHSEAKHCEIDLRTDEEGAALEIADDGNGPSGLSGAGSGLTGLAERARAVHGTVNAGPRTEGGFRLRVTIPLGGS